MQSLNLIRDELDNEWQEHEVRLRLLRREEDDDGQAVEEDQEPDQVRPDVDRLVVEPEPAAKVFQVQLMLTNYLVKKGRITMKKALWSLATRFSHSFSSTILALPYQISTSRHGSLRTNLSSYEHI